MFGGSDGLGGSFCCYAFEFPWESAGLRMLCAKVSPNAFFGPRDDKLYRSPLCKTEMGIEKQVLREVTAVKWEVQRRACLGVPQRWEETCLHSQYRSRAGVQSRSKHWEFLPMTSQSPNACRFSLICVQFRWKPINRAGSKKALGSREGRWPPP